MRNRSNKTNSALPGRVLTGALAFLLVWVSAIPALGMNEPCSCCQPGETRQVEPLGPAPEQDDCCHKETGPEFAFAAVAPPAHACQCNLAPARATQLPPASLSPTTSSHSGGNPAFAQALTGRRASFQPSPGMAAGAGFPFRGEPVPLHLALSVFLI